MAKSGTLKVRVLGDTGPFEKKLKGLKGSIGGLAGMVTKVGVTSFVALTSAAIGATFKLATMGDEIAKSAQKAGVGVSALPGLWEDLS